MTGSGKAPEHYQIEDFVTDESFINYFFHLNADDEAFWRKWLITHQDQRVLAEAAKEMLQNLSLTLSEREYKEELAKMRKAIDYEAPLFNNYRPVIVHHRPVIVRHLNWGNASRSLKEKKKYIKYLFPAILVFIIGGYFLLKSLAIKPGQLAEKYNYSSKPVVFTLSDGTVVTLAPQGVFRYPQDFGNKDRKVYLDGEAQFQVSSDEAHPFKVYSGDILSTVLGTIFNVKKEPGDSVLLVELIKGKLKVETINNPGLSSESIILNPDERVVYKRRDHKLYKEKWQSQNESHWQVNHLVFRQNNFDEIAEQLKTVFGVTVINQSNKENWRFTGEFKNSSAIDILESICIVEKLKYKVQGDTVFIK